MKQVLFLIKRESWLKSLLFLLILISSCVAKKKQAETSISQKKTSSKETMVLIKTNQGNIKVKLYNETPLHRDNFIKLVKTHSYDSTLFHRVIQNFMIQGGDPDSKRAATGVQLGNGEMGAPVPAEFREGIYHKKGALAAAREGDDVNPERKSSSCQFYIVQGKIFTDADLDRYEARINNESKQRILREYLNKPENIELQKKIMAFRANNQRDSIIKMTQSLDPFLQSELEKKGVYKFSPEQRLAYKTVGGTPHLDSGYTVFGEVVEGMETLDKIAAVKTDKSDRPIEDVRVLKMEIVK